MSDLLNGLAKKREEAGAAVISLRDESHKDGFQESPEFDERWKKANAAYDDAKQAEDKAVEADKRKRERDETANRVKEASARFNAEMRGRNRPDFDPNRDPRSQGLAALPTNAEFTRSFKLWASARGEHFDPTEEDFAVMRRCKVNHHSDTITMPTTRETVLMAQHFQEIFLETHPSRVAMAIRQAIASWNTMTPESAAVLSVPPKILQQVEINRLAWGGVLQVATIKQTDTGEEIRLPFTDDTTVKGRRIGEDSSLGTIKEPKVGILKWGSYKYTSDIIAVTYEMARDSFFDIETFIGDAGGERLGRILNFEFTRGTGNSMPRGIVFGAPVGKQTASSTAITTDEIIDLEASVDDAYVRGGTRVGYMLHKDILTYLRKLKDLEGRPFYILGQENGSRDRLNNKPVYINYDMDNTLVASAEPILFGDFSKYWVRQVGGKRVVRDPYTQRMSNDRELFAVIENADGNTVNAGTAPIKKLQMKP